MMQYSQELKKALDEMPIRTLHLKIIVLDFQERPIKEIQGMSQSGNISINGSAAMRRTINLSMFALKENSNLEDLNNLIALNKKIKVSVGYQSPIDFVDETIIWFECGTYVISSASVSISTTGATINITAKDKMVQLDGSIGGIFPASVTFHEYEQLYADNTSEKIRPTIYQIIREAVHTYGQIPYEKIKIFDLNSKQLTLVKYQGNSKLGFKLDYSSFKEIDNYDVNYPLIYEQGTDIGYLESDFIYPGELVFAAGETVTALLDKIVQTLGNYEYYFAINGDFIFQEKKNYIYNEVVSFWDILNTNYLKAYPEEWYTEIFNDTKATISLNNNPKYDNIKNDFIVWGKKEKGNGITVDIRYHLMVETKPVLNLCKQYLYKIQEEGLTYYQVSPELVSNTSWVLIGKPCLEWREELYRDALIRSAFGETDGFCDAELLEEWRKLYDTMTDYATKIQSGYWDGWNYNLLQDPGAITYWLDFLDTSSYLSQYNVSAIGRRSKIEKNDKCSYLFKNAVPEVLFATQPLSLEEKVEFIERYEDKGYSICFSSEDFINNKLSISSTGISAYEIIQNLLYTHLVYNSSITINCLPKFYLEPNTLIYLKNLENNIQGRFVINQMTLPLDYKGTMQIQATQALPQI